MVYNHRKRLLDVKIQILGARMRLPGGGSSVMVSIDPSRSRYRTCVSSGITAPGSHQLPHKNTIYIYSTCVMFPCLVLNVGLMIIVISTGVSYLRVCLLKVYWTLLLPSSVIPAILLHYFLDQKIGFL